MKYAAPLVLLLALVFLTGATTALASLAGQAKADLCCQHEAGQQVPADDGECTDLRCGCLSCVVPLLFTSTLDFPAIHESRSYWEWSRFAPSAPGRMIEYPPEQS